MLSRAADGLELAPRVFFMAHNSGGLIAMRLLTSAIGVNAQTRYRQVFARSTVEGAVFFSTPFAGPAPGLLSAAHTLLSQVGLSWLVGPSVAELLNPNNVVLSRLRADYAELCVPTLTLVEKLDFWGSAIQQLQMWDTSIDRAQQQLVPPQCGATVPFDVTYSQICRPSSERDVVYLTFLSFLDHPRSFCAPADVHGYEYDEQRPDAEPSGVRVLNAIAATSARENVDTKPEQDNALLALKLSIVDELSAREQTTPASLDLASKFLAQIEAAKPVRQLRNKLADAPSDGAGAASNAADESALRETALQLRLARLHALAGSSEAQEKARGELEKLADSLSKLPSSVANLTASRIEYVRNLLVKAR